MRLTRVPTRRYVVLILLVALVSCVVLARRRAGLERKTEHHARLQSVWRLHPNSCRIIYKKPDGSIDVLDFMVESEALSTVQRWSEPVKVIGRFDAQEMVRFHDRLEAKYRRASWRPWSAVAPDPPLTDRLSSATSL